jgi:hypothetical protein
MKRKTAMNIAGFVEHVGGAVSSPQLAEALGIDPALVRLWARENGVPLVGNSYVFTSDMASAFLADVLDEGDDDDDDDDDSDDSDDSDDEEEEGEDEDPDVDELLDSLKDDDDDEDDEEENDDEEDDD